MKGPEKITLNGCEAYCPGTKHMCRLGSECLDGNDLIEYIRYDIHAASMEAMSTAWPPRDTLLKLIEGCEILLNGHNYDGDGWEQIQCAVESAKEALAQAGKEGRE